MELEKWERDALGRYNDWLPNMKPITEDLFWNVISTYYVEGSGSKQVIDETIQKQMIPLTYFIIHRGKAGPEGVCFQKKVERAQVVRPDKFWSFKCCDHDWEIEINFMCYKEFKCKKCGRVSIIDSSD